VTAPPRITALDENRTAPRAAAAARIGQFSLPHPSPVPPYRAAAGAAARCRLRAGLIRAASPAANAAAHPRTRAARHRTARENRSPRREPKRPGRRADFTAGSAGFSRAGMIPAGVWPGPITATRRNQRVVRRLK
jgi:hypothetical protein